MIESVLGGLAGFAVGYLLTWPALIAFFIFGVLFEHNEARGWAIFMTIIAAVIAFFFFSVPFVNILWGALGYVIVGLVWSFYRYKRFVDKAVDRAKEERFDDSDKRRLIERLHPAKMWDTIVAWVIVWPLSAIDNILGDLINILETLVKKVFRGVYIKIYEMAVARLQ